MTYLNTKRFTAWLYLFFMTLLPLKAHCASTYAVIMHLQSPSRIYRIGEKVVLKVEVINNSKTPVGFSESPAGTFDVQVIDLSVHNLPDLMAPSRDRNAATLRSEFQTMAVEIVIDPSEQRKFDVHLFTDGLVLHPGKYQVVVSRRNIESKNVIVSNPVTLDIIDNPKSETEHK